MNNLTDYALVLFLSFVVERLTEYLGGTPFDKLPKLTPYKWLLMYVSVVFGMVLTIHYQLNLLALFGLPNDIIGQVISGILISGGANFISDIWGKFFPSTKPAMVIAETTTKVSIPQEPTAPVQ